MRGAAFLPKPGCRQQHVRIRAGEADDQRGHVFRGLSGELRRVGVQHFRHAGDLRRRLGCALRVVPGDQHVDVAADLLRGGDGVERRAFERGVIVFGDDESGHGVNPHSRESGNPLKWI